ncbi:MAG: molybdate ABC transporter substrate-binding protein [Beijerinckiaceae bacterium]
MRLRQRRARQQAHGGRGDAEAVAHRRGRPGGLGLTPPLRLLSAGSTVRGLRALKGALEQRIGRTVEIATDHGHNIADAMGAGAAPAAAVLLPRGMIDALVDAGRLSPRTVDLGAVATSAVVSEGARAPDVSTMDALRAALAGASRVLLTTAPSGEHMMRVIEGLGLADELRAKIMRFDRSSEINEWLARAGDASALGFGPETEIVGVEGVKHAGPIADEAQMVLPYAAAITPEAARDGAAQAFLDFLGTDDARAAFKSTGVRF